MKIRTFVCVELPDAERRRVGALQTDLKRHGARVSWGSPDTVHVTLAFLGDVDEERIPDVVAAVGEAASASTPLDLRIDGTGRFPPRGRPRVLWAGLGVDVAPLRALRERLVDALDRIGFPRDARPFAAHLTIGRVKDDRDPSLAAVVTALDAAALLGEPFHVDEVVVMRSELDPRGARHTPLARLPLGAPRV